MGVQSPLEYVEESELRNLIQEAIEALPPRRREIFILIRYHGLSYKEAAKVLNVAPQTVANNVSRALDSLRDALGPMLADFFPEGRSMRP